MCMNAENAEALNNVGITHVQVNSSQGCSGSYVKYQVAGEWYGFDYNGYVDTGYHDGYGGRATYSDGSSYAPPTPMYWNEGGGCGGGGTASSGGGFLKPVLPVLGMLGTSALLTHGEKSFYNTNSNTWRGKNGKLYDMNFNGNQHTGGKYKYGRRISKFFKTGNVALAFYNAYDIYTQYEAGEIDGYEAICEEVANVISQFGWYGFFFNVGWEGVQYLRSTQQYQELKFKIQYNRELRYLGETNQVNQELWDEWYKNYRP